MRLRNLNQRNVLKQNPFIFFISSACVDQVPLFINNKTRLINPKERFKAKSLYFDLFCLLDKLSQKASSTEMHSIVALQTDECSCFQRKENHVITQASCLLGPFSIVMLSAAHTSFN